MTKQMALETTQPDSFVSNRPIYSRPQDSHSMTATTDSSMSSKLQTPRKPFLQRIFSDYGTAPTDPEIAPLLAPARAQTPDTLSPSGTIHRRRFSSWPLGTNQWFRGGTMAQDDDGSYDSSEEEDGEDAGLVEWWLVMCLVLFTCCLVIVGWVLFKIDRYL